MIEDQAKTIVDKLIDELATSDEGYTLLLLVAEKLRNAVWNHHCRYMLNPRAADVEG